MTNITVDRRHFVENKYKKRYFYWSFTEV